MFQNRYAVPLITFPTGIVLMKYTYFNYDFMDQLMDLPLILGLPAYMLLLLSIVALIGAGFLWPITYVPPLPKEVQLRNSIVSQLASFKQALLKGMWAGNTTDLDQIYREAHDYADQLKGSNDVEFLGELDEALSDLLKVTELRRGLNETPGKYGDSEEVQRQLQLVEAGINGFHGYVVLQHRLRNAALTPDVLDRAELLATRGGVTTGDLEPDALDTN